MDYTAKKSLEIFSELCGERNFANVRIVTTDWDGVDEYEGEAREKALSKRYFNHLIDGGAKMFRHDGALDSAQSIVSGLIEQPPVTLKMQEELDTGRALGNTSAGAVVMREMKEMQKKHEVWMQTLKDEMEQESKDMRDHLEAEHRKLVKRMAQIQEDSKRLEETRLAPHTPEVSIHRFVNNRNSAIEILSRMINREADSPVLGFNAANLVRTPSINRRKVFL